MSNQTAGLPLTPELKEWLALRDAGAIWCRSCGYRGSVFGPPTVGKPCSRCGTVLKEDQPDAE